MVTPRGNLVVTSPRGTSPAQISQALARHRGWIEQKAAERREAWACLKEGTFYLLGRPYPLPSAGSQGKPGAPPGQEIKELPGLACLRLARPERLAEPPSRGAYPGTAGPLCPGPGG